MEIRGLKYTFNNSIIWKKIEEDDSYIILAHNPDTGDMYEFNDIGSELFLLIKDNTSMDTVLGVLLKEYDVTLDDIKEDVTVFIERFIDLKIIETMN